MTSSRCINIVANKVMLSEVEGLKYKRKFNSLRGCHSNNSRSRKCPEVWVAHNKDKLQVLEICSK